MTISKYALSVAVVITLLLSSVAGVRADAQTDAAAPRFSDHPSRADDVAMPVPLNLASSDTLRFRTRLQAGIRRPANFASSNVLVLWGCGTGCVFGAVDRRTGHVAFLPGSICCWDNEGDMLIYRKDSRLLVLGGLINEDGVYGAHFYELTDGDFRLLKTVPVQRAP